jgi:hypothetical protein
VANALHIDSTGSNKRVLTTNQSTIRIQKNGNVQIIGMITNTILSLTLLLPDSNFKRRCVRHNILTSSIVDVLEQEKALFVLAATLVQYMPTILNVPVFLYSDS